MNLLGWSLQRLLPLPASRGAASLACGPSSHPHSQQRSISRLSLPLTLLPPSYEDPVMTLGPLGSPGLSPSQGP